PGTYIADNTIAYNHNHVIGQIIKSGFQKNCYNYEDADENQRFFVAVFNNYLAYKVIGIFRDRRNAVCQFRFCRNQFLRSKQNLQRRNKEQKGKCPENGTQKVEYNVPDKFPFVRWNEPAKKVYEV